MVDFGIIPIHMCNREFLAMTQEITCVHQEGTVPVPLYPAGTLCNSELFVSVRVIHRCGELQRRGVNSC